MGIDNKNKGIKGIELEDRANKYIRKSGIKHKKTEQEGVEETNRTLYRRQRDKILYTGGFRRLQDKTQVIAATKTGDHRTRLTHSLEVEQIAISVADALGLNRDLVSAIAIGHDVGHTPFGHAVERFLNEQLEGKGGFSHAVQSIRYLSSKNLEKEILEGILKHDTDVYVGAYDKNQFDCDVYNPNDPGSLEAQVVYWADKLAYITHDFEDFYKSEIYEEAKKDDKDLERNLQAILAKLIIEKEKEIFKDIEKFETRDLIRNLLKHLVNQSLKDIEELESNMEYEKKDVTPETVKIETKKRIIEEQERLFKEKEKDISRLCEILGIEKYSCIDEIKESIDNLESEFCESKKSDLEELEKVLNKIKKESYTNGMIINFDKEYRTEYLNLRRLLDDHYICSPQVKRSDSKANKIAEALFKEFDKNPGILPLNIIRKIKLGESDKERVIADYIASMTDRYAEEVFLNLTSIGSYYKY